MVSMSCLLRLEDRGISVVTHLAWLGLKMQETAFLVVSLYKTKRPRLFMYKRGKSSIH